jgi:hypothetical protein
MKEKVKEKQQGHAGVSDFLKFMYDGQPEWSLVAVKAPLDDVSEELVDFRGAKTFTRDVPRKPGGEYDDVAQSVAVVQVKHSPWTIIYRSLLYVDEGLLEAVTEEAKELSARLNTRAISFIGEDTAGANRYELFEKGKLLELAEWESGGEFFRFKSTLRKRPDLEEVTDEFVDEFFKQEGVYLPACYAMSDGENSWLAHEKSAGDVIERADLIELEEEEEDEDEDYEDEDEA